MEMEWLWILFWCLVLVNVDCAPLFTRIQAGDSCASACVEEECIRGCDLWQSSLNSSCERSCTEQYPENNRQRNSSMVNCRQGCDYAVNNYIRGIEDKLKPPSVKIDSVTNASLSLNMGEYPGVPLHVQYAEWPGLISTTAPEFKYFKPDINATKKGIVSVSGLLAYTTYRFRVAWVPTMHDIIYSPASLPVRTLSYGTPEPPRITSFAAISSHQVIIKWEPPLRPNGQIISYRLLYGPASHSIPSEDNGMDGNQTTRIIQYLRPLTQYNIKLAASNENGEGKFSIVHVITPPIPPQSRNKGFAEFVPVSIVKGLQSELRLFKDVNIRSYDPDQPTIYPFGEPFPKPYPILDDTKFQDFVVDTVRNLSFISQGTGKILLVDFANRKDRVIYENRGLEISKMTYDWMNKQLYFVDKAEIYRCEVAELDLPIRCVSLGDAHSEIRKIVADPLNGYLFILVSLLHESSSVFYRLPLVPSSPVKHPDLLSEAHRFLEYEDPLVTFDVIFETCTIVFPDKEGILRKGACDGTDLKKVVFGQFRPRNRVTGKFSFSGVTDILHSNGMFYGMNRSVLLLECYNHTSGQFSQTTEEWTPYTGGGHLTGIQPFHREARPEPYPTAAPSSIPFFLSSDKVHMKWQPPSRLPWQSDRAWNQWSYSYQMGNTIASETDSTSAVFGGLEPNSNYTFNVQAFARTRSGPVSEDVTVRTLPATAVPPEILGIRDRALLSLSLNSPSGAQTVRESYRFLLGVSDIVWAPTFIGVYRNKADFIVVPTSTETDLVENLVQHIPDAQSLAYDWIGRKLYWSSHTKRAIYRKSLDEIGQELLVDSEDAKQVVLDPLRAVMYWCSDLVVRVGKLNGLQVGTIFKVDPLTDDRVRRIAIDYSSKKVYIFVQRSNVSEVYARPLSPVRSNLTASKIAEVNRGAISDSMMGVFDERLIAVNGEGNVVMTDLFHPQHTLVYEQKLPIFALVPHMEQDLRALNRTIFDFQAVPSAVNKSEIDFVEEDEKMVLSWPPVKNCNYGAVQYEVSVKDRDNEIFHENVWSEKIIIPLASFAAQLTVSIRPLTEWGQGNVTVRTFGAVQVPGHARWSATNVFLTICGPSIVLLLVLVGLFWCFRDTVFCRRIKRLTSRGPTPSGDRDARSPLSENATYELCDLDLSALPKLDRSRIQLSVDPIGRGAFGEVYSGYAIDLLPSLPGTTVVAVKQLLKSIESDTRAQFLKEACSMNGICHKNILRFHGVCVDADPYYIVMEFMDSGDLREYLRDRLPACGDNSAAMLTLGDALEICRDIAEGCAYLQQKKMVHRDLAARNCLVTHENGLRVVKIGDFGLARDIYVNHYYRQGQQGRVPVRWMAPESLDSHVFTTESDVWSFGVVMWEVLTVGETPYGNCCNDTVIQNIRNGWNPMTVSGPLDVPFSIRNLMLQCWMRDPKRRPSFVSCLQVILSVLQEEDDPERVWAETDEKKQCPDSPTVRCKSGSYPTMRPINRNHNLYRSSPECLDRDSPTSMDSGVAVTPKWPPRDNSRRDAGTESPVPVLPPPPLHDDDFIAYMPAGRSAPADEPYLAVLYTSCQPNEPNVPSNLSRSGESRPDPPSRISARDTREQLVDGTPPASLPFPPGQNLFFANHVYMNAQPGAAQQMPMDPNYEIPMQF